MTVAQIISKFETWVDDGTELSAQDELDLFNKVYGDVWTSFEWEIVKKSFSGTISGTSIDLPTDFAYVAKNARYTEIFTENVISNQSPKIIWVGDNYYILVNYSDRKQYTSGGYCWVDLTTNKLVFSESLSGTVEYDYVSFPTDLTTSDEPIFPSAYQPMFYHLMASDDYIIQQFDKARSYAPENASKAGEYLSRMKMWNAKLTI